MSITTTDSIIRLVIALILGAIIGYERQAQNKAAGLRTHILVCIGSCLCMILSINIAMDHFMLYGYRNSDPERIAAQVISGVGFLGAGTILANQKARNVRGLTTAAGLWAVAAIGLVTGAGYLGTAIAGTVLIFVVLTVFVRLDLRLHDKHRVQYAVHMEMKNSVGQIRRLLDLLKEEHLKLESFHVLSEEDAPAAELELVLSAVHRLDDDEILAALMSLRGVRKAECSEIKTMKPSHTSGRPANT
ncbi:MgtC/SapB family protein [uncultured Megasphaera sp.]|uniref:MgtC/SapB family protein n=1 Tax=uncultured Megasphaera sp. TaxID=165188 RepID=UPI00265A89E2|nr:MgtC/SapB family protein [uncultured Megasphaera sp.]